FASIEDVAAEARVEPEALEGLLDAPLVALSPVQADLDLGPRLDHVLDVDVALADLRGRGPDGRLEIRGLDVALLEAVRALDHPLAAVLPARPHADDLLQVARLRRGIAREVDPGDTLHALRRQWNRLRGARGRERRVEARAVSRDGADAPELA